MTLLDNNRTADAEALAGEFALKEPTSRLATVFAPSFFAFSRFSRR